LHGPSRHLQLFLSEHTLAITLYGPTVLTVPVGVQKMMVVGCILYFYMLLNGRGTWTSGSHRPFSSICSTSEGHWHRPKQGRSVSAQRLSQFIFCRQPKPASLQLSMHGYLSSLSHL
jgi:hypothetical protein